MEGKDIRVEQARVIRNQEIADRTFELRLDFLYPAIFSPGQFVCLAPLDPQSVMPRPFSICQIALSPLKKYFSILYRVVGKNTELMSKLIAGDKVNFFGPCGQGFLPKTHVYPEVWLVGGGIGIAPLFFFHQVLSEFRDLVVRVFYGNRTMKEIIPTNLGDSLVITTDDGSHGQKGLVTDVFGVMIKGYAGQSLINLDTDSKVTKRYDGRQILVITCGPNIMMRKVAEICEQAKIECHVILETIMACGLNSCKGCSIKTVSGMKSVCHDGPVFNAKEVLWDELG